MRKNRKEEKGGNVGENMLGESCVWWRGGKSEGGKKKNY